MSFIYRRGKTQIDHRHTKAPLKLQRPFYPEGDRCCHTVMLHTAGGIVGGDCLHHRLTLHPDAHALVTTAAAAKVYRSAGGTALQTTEITIESGACLEWFPQEIILFNGAHYRQQVHVSLAADALWLGWDIVRLGRSARGETLQSGSWRSETVVHQGGKPVWIDLVGINGDSELLSSLNGLNQAPVVGTFVAIGRDAPPSLVAACRQQAIAVQAAHQTGVSGDRSPKFGVTRLMSGLLCRYQGASSAQARQWFEGVWSVVREHHLQRSGCRPRVWP
ncbi:MAG: urease accessory protein UreD [Elainellaceae cyanobacterium]